MKTEILSKLYHDYCYNGYVCFSNVVTLEDAIDDYILKTLDTISDVQINKIHGIILKHKIKNGIKKLKMRYELDEKYKNNETVARLEIVWKWHNNDDRIKHKKIKKLLNRINVLDYVYSEDNEHLYVYVQM